MIAERCEQLGCLADPVGEGGAVEVEPVALEDPGLAIERQVVGVLADHHIGEQAGTGTVALDGPRGQRGLDEPYASAEGRLPRWESGC